MDSEYNQLVNLLGGPQGQINNNQVVLCKCGIGKVNAALGCTDFIAQHAPDCIVSTGVAGGIDSSLQVMDLVAASQTVYHDVWCGPGNAVGQVQGLPERFAAAPRLLQAALRISSGATVRQGLICTGDQFITNHQELAVIKSKFPEGLAVDMESAAIAHTCHLRNVPFLSLRIISDTPGAAPDHWQQYTNFWAELGTRAFQAIASFLHQL